MRIRWLFVLLVVLLTACATDAAAPPTPGAAAGTGSTSTVGTSAPGAPEVEPIAITIHDDAVGALSFDALAAGDPARAAEGRLVLLFHGFPETADAYRDLLGPLAAAGYYAVAVTQRGYSPDARPPDVAAYGIVELADDAFAVAEQLGAPTFHVVGHDWGGAVAWLAATLRPDLVTSVTALSTPHPDAMAVGLTDPADPQHAASAYMQTLRQPDSEQAFYVDGTATFRRTFGPEGGGLPADHVDAYAEVLDGPEAMRTALDWYRANPLPPPTQMGPVRVPALYVWGTDDRAFTRSSAERTADFVEGPYTYVELVGEGHWLPERAPDAVLDALLAHLAAVEDGAG